MYGRKKILVVDDEKAIRDLVAHHMRISGFDVVVADRGALAVDLFFDARPDLVILDIMIPGVDGWKVCEYIKGHPDSLFTPVIILSALAGVEYKLKGFEAGADDYITKPFSPRELVARVKRILATGAVRQEKVNN